MSDTTGDAMKTRAGSTKIKINSSLFSLQVALRQHRKDEKLEGLRLIRLQIKLYNKRNKIYLASFIYIAEPTFQDIVLLI